MIRRPSDLIPLAALALLALGVVMVASAGMTISASGAADPVTIKSILTSRSAVYAAIALVALIATALLPLRPDNITARTTWWVPLLWPAIIAGLLLVYLPGLGHEVNGAARWVALPGGLTLQPSEFAKWGAILLIAWYAWRNAGALHRFFQGLAPALIVLGTITVLVTKEDLGTGFLIAAVGCTILIAAGAKIWHFLLISPVLMLGLLAALVASPYRLERLRAYIDPYADPDGTGYHIIQSLVAIAGGRGTGRGLGFGLQKFGYLPEDRTDFLFAIVCEELGIAGAALTIALYAALILAAAGVTRRLHHPFLKLTALGVTATLAFQSLMNLMVVTGLAPTKGIALPLMSAGGTGWILTAAALGLLIAMDRYSPASEPIEPQASAEPGGTATRAPDFGCTN